MCTVVAGDFPMDIQWFKDAEQITDTESADRRIQQLDESTVILYLTRLSLNHSGNYTCLAKNSAGNTSHTASLFVKGASCSNPCFACIGLSV
jgi:hypothetical protein